MLYYRGTWITWHSAEPCARPAVFFWRRSRRADAHCVLQQRFTNHGEIWAVGCFIVVTEVPSTVALEMANAIFVFEVFCAVFW